MHLAEDRARSNPASLSEERAAKVQAAIDAAKAVTRSGEEAKNTHITMSVDARLGMLLRKKSMKASEIIQRWDPSGDGQIDIFEFRTHVRGLGLDASNDELDDLFRSLDEDGGGTLDMPEVKHALNTLQEAASSSEKAAKKFDKSQTGLLKSAEATMKQVHQLMNEDKQLIAEEEQRKRREEKEEVKRLAHTKEMKRRASMDRAAKAESEKAAFEAKIAARRSEVVAKA